MLLGDLILLSSSSGVAFDNFDGISLIVLMRKLAFFVCWIMPLLGLLGMGPSISFFSLPKSLVFFWDSEQAGWIRPGLPPLRMMTEPIQHFRSAIWQAWQGKVAADLSRRKGVRGGL